MQVTPAWSRPLTRQRVFWLAGAYGALWLVLAFKPIDRAAWALENLLVLMAVATIVALRHQLRLSLASYTLIGAFLALHALGAHYTYSLTPPGFWLQELLGLDRNHYDRIVHFGFGFLLARPFLEVSEGHGDMRRAWAYAYAFLIVVAASTLYELTEWIVASLIQPEEAMAWLGTQGDPFDAQKDTGLATVGAALALGLIALYRRQKALRTLPAAKSRVSPEC